MHFDHEAFRGRMENILDTRGDEFRNRAQLAALQAQLAVLQGETPTPVTESEIASVEAEISALER